MITRAAGATHEFCRFCCGTRLEFATDLSTDEYSLFRCLVCGGVFSPAGLSAERRADRYAEMYEPGGEYEPHRREMEFVKAGLLPRLGWNRALFFGKVARGSGCGQRVVELGCGPGVFGLACLQRGYTYAGYDIVASVVEDVRASTGIPLFVGTWETIVQKYSPGSLDYAVAWEVLEHLPDVRECVMSLRTLLRPEGRLVASVPNFLRRKHDRSSRLGQVGPPIHMNFWSPEAMTHFLHASGFRHVDVYVKPVKRFSWRRLPRVMVEAVGSKLGLYHGPTMVVVAS